MFGHYLKVTWRNMLKYRLQSVVSVMGMAIGFVAFVLGGYWWYWETHFDAFHPDAGRTFAVTTNGLTKDANGIGTDLNQLHKEDAAFFRQNIPEIENICLLEDCRLDILSKEEIKNFCGYGVDSLFFQFFFHRFLEGNYKGVPENGEWVILTEKMAKYLFNTIHCTGMDVCLKNERNQENVLKVAGVIADYPDNSDLKFHFLLLKKPQCRPYIERLTTYVRLYENADVKAVRQKIESHKSVAVTGYCGGRDSWKFHLLAHSDVHLKCNHWLSDHFRNIRIIAFAGLLVFLSALMNHLVLFIGQQQRKIRELTTRMSLGSSRKGVALKALTDLFLPVFLTFLISFCLIELIFPFYQDFTRILPPENFVNSGFISQMQMNGLVSIALETAGITVLSFFGIGFLLVWGLQRGYLGVIPGTRNMPGAFIMLRRSLIVIQIFIGSFFMITSFVMFRQLYFMKNSDKGIQCKNITQVYLGFNTVYYYGNSKAESLKTELLGNHFIEDVTLTTDPILSKDALYYGNLCTFVPVHGREEGEEEAPDQVYVVEPNFFNFFGLKLKSGRFPQEEDADGCYVVNESGERELGFSNLTELPLDERTQRITGVIYDYHYAPLRLPVQKVFFQSLSRKSGHCFAYMYVKFRPGGKEQGMVYLRESMKKYDLKEVPGERMYKDLVVLQEEFNKPEQTAFVLFSVLSVLSILISSFGVYSLVALATEQRRKEIAIRKINGATFTDVLQLFTKEYLILVIIGNIFALLSGYLFLRNWLESYAYRINLEMGVFIWVFLITCLIVVFSVFLQVFSSTRSNPADVVKRE